MIRDAILVGLFSWIGVLTRIGLIELYDHTFIHGNIAGPITKNFYPNVVGCAILGFLVSLQTKIKAKYPPLYAGLASGLCGSLTTFSGLSEEASQQLVDHNVTSFFAVLFVGFGCPYWILLLGVNTAAYYFPVPLPSSAPVAMAAVNTSTNANSQNRNTGNNTEENNETNSPENYGTMASPSIPSNEDDATGVATAPEADESPKNNRRTSTSTNNTPKARRTSISTNNTPSARRASTSTDNQNEDDETGVATAPEITEETPKKSRRGHRRFYSVAVLCGVAVVVMLALLASLPARPSYIVFSLLFAPFGALTRWYLATYNIKFPKFPVFTFLVNFVGSMLVAGFTILVSRSNNATGSAALNGAVTGFCGSLTTTSTFLNEARILNTKYSIIYVLVSVFVTQMFLLAINGPYAWR